jgi:hypothetical protein
LSPFLSSNWWFLKHAHTHIALKRIYRHWCMICLHFQIR